MPDSYELIDLSLAIDLQQGLGEFSSPEDNDEGLTDAVWLFEDLAPVYAEPCTIDGEALPDGPGKIELADARALLGVVLQWRDKGYGRANIWARGRDAVECGKH